MFVAVVRTVRPLADSSYAFDLQVERERIPGLRMEDMTEQNAVRLALPHLPAEPADEAVDGIRVLRLVERKLVPAALELVASVLQPVGPRNEQLTPTPGRHLVDAVPVHDVLTVDRVRPQPSAYLDGDRALLGEHHLELLAERLHGATSAARADGRRRAASSPSQERALGTTAPMLKKRLASTT